MSYPKKLLRMRPTKGLAFDTPSYELGPDHYSNGNNVIFRNAFARRVGGSRAVYGTLPVDPVLHILNSRVDTTNFWLFFGADEVHALETTNSDEVTPSGGLTAVAQPWQYSSTLLNGVPVFTNGFEKPQYWAGNVVTPFAALPDWPATTSCKSIVAFKFHLFALDIDGPGGHFENQIKWSDAADPGTVPGAWTPAADNEAGDALLADTPGPALMGLALRGTLMLYKRSSTYPVNYVGGNEVFSIGSPAFTSSGVLTRHGACDVNGQHFVVTDGDIILTDGTNRRSVGQARMREYLFGSLDQDNYENVFTVFNRAKGEVIVAFPEAGSQYCTKALVYDVANDSLGVRDLEDVTCAAVGIVNDTDPDESWAAAAYTWAAASQLWNKQNFSFATESLVIGFDDVAEMQDTEDAVPLDASVGRYDLHFGEPERVKFLRRVHVRAVAGYGTLFVRVGARMTPSDDITWSSEQTLTEPEQIVNAFAQGRYISVEIRSAGSEVWTVTGIDLEAELRGYF